MAEKIKHFSEPLFFIGVVLLIGGLGFGLGRLSRIEESREPLRIIEPVSQAASVAALEPGKAESAAGQYVGSKNGKVYHLPWCSGAQRIKDENKIYFQTKAEAEKAGYTPAANCKGI